MPALVLVAFGLNPLVNNVQQAQGLFTVFLSGLASKSEAYLGAGQARPLFEKRTPLKGSRLAELSGPSTDQARPASILEAYFGCDQARHHAGRLGQAT